MKYDNTNTFSLSKNLDKKEERHPDYKGSLNIEGKEYWLSGWNRDGKNGKFISGAIKPKEEKKSTYKKSDDDIMF